MIIQTKNANEVSEQVNAFYMATGRPTKKVDPTDKVVLALLYDEILGVVRLCFEHGNYVLRTMQVHPNFQRRGIGYRKIDNSMAPQFLQQRLIEAVKQYPDESFINMIRKKKSA